jgi:hypothetical protein
MEKDYINKLNNVLNVSREEFTTRDLILQESEAVTNLLLLKNEAYGDSALNPAGIFAGGDAVHNLCCRIDDKLMRIKMRGITDETEDTVQDLIGYLILLKVALRLKK